MPLCRQGKKFSAQMEGAGAGIIVSQRVGPASGRANIFYEKVGLIKAEDEVSFAAGYDFSLRTIVRCSAEIYGRKSSLFRVAC